MNSTKKVLIFGAAGRVGLGLAKALLRHHVDVCAADYVEEKHLAEKMARMAIDLRLSNWDTTSRVNVHGCVDVLDEAQVTRLLVMEKPDVVVNYAIPFTWDATKRLPNYKRVSAAGLGAFAAVQVLAPKIIAQAIAKSEIDATYIVGNLPDITIPILYGLQKQQSLVLPIAGAGNVGLIEAGLKHTIATERQLNINDLSLSLVAHHVHWVAPREPGYPNDAPFLLKVIYQGTDITKELGDTRALINRSIVKCYEAGAGFSSTTALLAAQLILSLLDEEGKSFSLHVPAPNGLPGGYPVTVKQGTIELALPSEWHPLEAAELMRQAHQRDGIEKIGDDGSIHFNPNSVVILNQELGIDLPLVLLPGDLDIVAREQIRLAQIATAKL